MPSPRSVRFAGRRKRSYRAVHDLARKQHGFHTFYDCVDTRLTELVSGKYPSKCDIDCAFLPALFIRHQRCFRPRASRLCAALQPVNRIVALSSKDPVMLTDQEISSLQDVVPRLLSEAKTASPGNANFIFTMELETHLQPGLRGFRIRAPESSIDSTPPYPLNLFVGIPVGELRTLAHAAPAQRDCAHRALRRHLFASSAARDPALRFAYRRL